MDLDILTEILKNGPKFRLTQAKKAVFQDLIGNWNEASVLPLELRQELNKKCPLEIDGQIFVSKNKQSDKAIIILKDGLKIETVLMRHKDKRNTICVSSQIGCALGCLFCATGRMGFKRDLKADEIISQVLFFARYLKNQGEKITNIVFMGMGEPFLNYGEVMKAIRIFNDKDCFNIGARKISISTIGIVEGIEKLANEDLDVNLAISLHAPDDLLRQKLIPVTQKYLLKDIFSVVDAYIKKKGRRVMFEYLLLKDFNDSDQCAEKLARLTRRPLYFVNLLSYNMTGCGFKPSSQERIKRFKEILENRGVAVTTRYRFGSDIKGACGQLVS